MNVWSSSWFHALKKVQLRWQILLVFDANWILLEKFPAIQRQLMRRPWISFSFFCEVASDRIENKNKSEMIYCFPAAERETRRTPLNQQWIEKLNRSEFITIASHQCTRTQTQQKSIILITWRIHLIACVSVGWTTFKAKHTQHSKNERIKNERVVIDALRHRCTQTYVTNYPRCKRIITEKSATEKR